MPIRDVSLHVDVVGHGHPLLLMHGGPGLDHWSLNEFRACADDLTLVFYDHRCNGRSEGAPVTTMTWDNLVADADALREALGFERWAVLGHSFGGHVALEYALRHPDRLTHLVLLDTAADSRWARDNAPRVLAARGWPSERVEACRRFFHGEIEPKEMLATAMRFGKAYYHNPSLLTLARELAGGMWRMKSRPEALVFASRVLLDGWSVVDRLGEITVPTLVMAGRDDFLFPPEAQHELASGIPNARLRIIDAAGHHPHVERRDATFRELRDFIGAASGVAAPEVARST
jgi:proline iminopeptidase